MSVLTKASKGRASHLSEVIKPRKQVESVVYLSPTSDNWGEYTSRKESKPPLEGSTSKRYWLLPPNEQSDLSNVCYPVVDNKKRTESFYIVKH